MKKCFLFTFLFFYYHFVFSQTTGLLKFNSPIGPSPTAASLGKYGDIPTSNYTGVPKIIVPVYDIKIGANVIPINLSYHAGGVKVTDESSWVGLGWSLNAGGVITRTKKMNDDLAWNGFFKRNDHTEIGDKSDKEQDMFYFNFLGFSGKFVIDYSSDAKQPYVIRMIGSYDDDNLKVDLINNSTWQITDKFGTVYQFSTIEMTNEILISGGAGSGFKDETNFISTWCLSKIIYFNGEEVVFNYTDGAEIENLPVVESVLLTKKGYSFNGDLTCYTPPQYFGTELTTSSTTAKVRTKILSEIVFPGGKVNFNSVKDRIDLRCENNLSQRLSNIEIYSQNATAFDLLKTFKLVQSYFSSSSRAGYLSKRLKFDKLLEVGITSQSPTYSFAYNNISLPDKDSNDMDHWGYYNGPNNNKTLFSSGGLRNPSASYVKAGLLQSITYPTNGATEFFFEINDFSNLGKDLKWTSVNAGNTGMLGAGVRIQKILNSRGYVSATDGETYTETQFTYLNTVNKTGASSGQIMSKIYYHSDYEGLSMVPNLGPGKCSATSGLPIRLFGSMEYSNSSIPISGDAQGNVIGYDNVKVKNIGLSGVEHTTVETFNNSSSASLQTFLRVPSVNNNSNGLLKTKILNLVKDGIEYPVKKFEYTYSTASSTILNNYIIISSYGATGVLKYDIACEWITLTRVVEKDLQPEGNSFGSFLKVTDNYYNASNKQKRQVDVYDSRYANNSTRYRYPSDLVEGGRTFSIYDLMVMRNMVGVVIQEEKYKDNLLLGKTFMDYSGSRQTLVQLDAIRSQYMSNDPEIRLNYHKYGPVGNPLSVSYEKGPKTSYLWSYDNHYPIAEIKNASYTEIENILGAENIRNFGNQHHPSKTMIDDFLAPLNISLINAQIGVYYYKPMVGIIGQKDIKGMNTYYEYDDLQRLKYIKDNDNNIIKSFKYHLSEPNN